MSRGAWLRWIPAVALMLAIAWSSHQPRWPEAVQGLPDWLLHGTVFGALGAAVLFGFDDMARRRPWRAAAVAIVVTSVYGVSDELHQSFVPGRVADVGDWLADTIGAALVVGAGTRWRNR